MLNSIPLWLFCFGHILRCKRNKCDKNNSKEKSKEKKQGKEQEKFELYKKPHDSLLLTVANLFPFLDSAHFFKFAYFLPYTFVSWDSLSFHMIRSHFYLNVPPFIFGLLKNQTTALQMDRTMLTLGSLIVLKIGFSRILAHAALRKSRHWFSITNLLLASTNSIQLHSHNVTTSNAKNLPAFYSHSRIFCSLPFSCHLIQLQGHF